MIPARPPGLIVVTELRAIEALARTQLAAHRCGWRVTVVRCSPETAELLALSGLPECVGLRVQVIGQAKQGEEAGGIEEEGDAVDPAL
jgi:hypothetical protein